MTALSRAEMIAEIDALSPTADKAYVTFAERHVWHVPEGLSRRQLHVTLQRAFQVENRLVQRGLFGTDFEQAVQLACENEDLTLTVHEVVSLVTLP